MSSLPEKRLYGSWVQTERAQHERWAQFLALKGATAASRVMHLLLARIAEHNAVVISQKTLASLLKCDERTVRRAVVMLREHNWIDIRQIGDRGTVNAYVVNDRVAWTGRRDGLRYSLFSAIVVVSEEEQPDRDQLGHQGPLQRLPSVFRGETQLPSGPGLPPPSQPFFDGMEPDLPAIAQEDDDDDLPSPPTVTARSKPKRTVQETPAPEPQPKLLRKAGAAVKAALAPPTSEDWARGRKNLDEEILQPTRKMGARAGKAVKAVGEKLSTKLAPKEKPRLKPA